jgi:hypothetical protein
MKGSGPLRCSRLRTETNPAGARRSPPPTRVKSKCHGRTSGRGTNSNLGIHRGAQRWQVLFLAPHTFMPLSVARRVTPTNFANGFGFRAATAPVDPTRVGVETPPAGPIPQPLDRFARSNRHRHHVLGGRRKRMSRSAARRQQARIWPPFTWPERRRVPTQACCRPGRAAGES